MIVGVSPASIDGLPLQLQLRSLWVGQLPDRVRGRALSQNGVLLSLEEGQTGSDQV